jgi:hypothetical protein
VTPEARRILVEAKGLVSLGWFRCNPWFDTGGNVEHNCLYTAVEKAGGKGFNWDAPFFEAMAALHTAAGLPHRDNDLERLDLVINFNNAPERTHEEVVALFDKALLQDSEREPQRKSVEAPSPDVLSHPLGSAVNESSRSEVSV